MVNYFCFQFSDGFGGDAALGVAGHGSLEAALGVIGVKFLDGAAWPVNNRLNVLLINSAGTGKGIIYKSTLNTK